MNRIFIFQTIDSFPRIFSCQLFVTGYNSVYFILEHMLQNCFMLPMLPVNAYFSFRLLGVQVFFISML